MKAKHREGAIRELAQGLLDAGQLGSDQLNGIVNAILKRKELGSTGMGHGVAIPHTKYSGVPQTTGIVAVSQGGVEFASLDGEPVYVFFLLVSPSETPDNHVLALEKIARLVRDGTFFRIAGHGADGDVERLRQTAALDNLDSALRRIRRRIERTLSPPGDRLVTGVSLMFKTDEFRFAVAPADAERLEIVVGCAAIGVDTALTIDFEQLVEI